MSSESNAAQPELQAVLSSMDALAKPSATASQVLSHAATANTGARPHHTPMSARNPPTSTHGARQRTHASSSYGREAGESASETSALGHATAQPALVRICDCATVSVVVAGETSLFNGIGSSDNSDNAAVVLGPCQWEPMDRSARRGYPVPYVLRVHHVTGGGLTSMVR